jgi:uncharacterized membrane protein
MNWILGMSPATRRLVQAVLYEAFAIAFVGPVLSLLFAQPVSSTLALAVVMSAIALVWNWAFNGLFEAWESGQLKSGRSAWRRLAHGVGFEGGLVVLLVPLTAYWLDISLLGALLAELGLLAFFLIYAVGFTWAFDRVFGLPVSARGADER